MSRRRDESGFHRPRYRFLSVTKAEAMVPHGAVTGFGHTTKAGPLYDEFAHAATSSGAGSKRKKQHRGHGSTANREEPPNAHGSEGRRQQRLERHRHTSMGSCRKAADRRMAIELAAARDKKRAHIPKIGLKVMGMPTAGVLAKRRHRRSRSETPERDRRERVPQVPHHVRVAAELKAVEERVAAALAAAEAKRRDDEAKRLETVKADRARGLLTAYADRVTFVYGAACQDDPLEVSRAARRAEEKADADKRRVKEEGTEVAAEASAVAKRKQQQPKIVPAGSTTNRNRAPWATSASAAAEQRKKRRFDKAAFPALTDSDTSDEDDDDDDTADGGDTKAAAEGDDCSDCDHDHSSSSSQCSPTAAKPPAKKTAKSTAGADAGSAASSAAVNKPFGFSLVDEPTGPWNVKPKRVTDAVKLGHLDAATKPATSAGDGADDDFVVVNVARDAATGTAKVTTTDDTGSSAPPPPLSLAAKEPAAATKEAADAATSNSTTALITTPWATEKVFTAYRPEFIRLLAEKKKAADELAEADDDKARAVAATLTNPSQNGAVRLRALYEFVARDSPSTVFTRTVLSHLPYRAMLALVAAMNNPKRWPRPEYAALPWHLLLTGDVVHSTLERYQGRACRDWIGRTDMRVIPAPPSAHGPALVPLAPLPASLVTANTGRIPGVPALEDYAALGASTTDMPPSSSDTPLSLLGSVFNTKTGKLRTEFMRRALDADELSHPRLMPRVTEFSRNIARAAGAPSAVSSYTRFLRNFDAFSSRLFRDIDFTHANAVIGGGAVTACLMPLPLRLEQAHADVETAERVVKKLPVPAVLLPLINGYACAAEAASDTLSGLLHDYFNVEQLSSEDVTEDENVRESLRDRRRDDSTRHQPLSRHEERAVERQYWTSHRPHRYTHNGHNPFWNSDIDIFLLCDNPAEAAAKLEWMCKQLLDNHKQLLKTRYRQQREKAHHRGTPPPVADPNNEFEDHHYQYAKPVVVRTSNAVTLVFGYPFRNVQLITMLHRSVDELLAFSDLDCTAVCFAPGKQGVDPLLVRGDTRVGVDDGRVFCVPRSVRAFNTLCNFVSPARLRRTTTPKRLIKYVARGFTSLLFELCKHNPVRCDVVIDDATLAAFTAMERDARGTEATAYDETFIPYGPHFAQPSRVQEFLRQQTMKAQATWHMDAVRRAAAPGHSVIPSLNGGGGAGAVAARDDGTAAAKVAAEAADAKYRPPWRVGESFEAVWRGTGQDPFRPDEYDLKPMRFKRDELLDSRLVDAFLPRCYMCLRRYAPNTTTEHSKLCRDCHDLNASKRAAQHRLPLAAPGGRVAVVTGARIKIGYATVLSLLRSGVTVAGVTRFPRDAAARFRAEPDFADWRDRCHLYGVDLRDLPSVNAFIAHVKQHYAAGLFALINNAAQSVRRPPAYYREVFALETAKHAAAAAGTLDRWEQALVKSFAPNVKTGVSPNPFAASPADPPRVVLALPSPAAAAPAKTAPAPMSISVEPETPKPTAAATTAAVVADAKVPSGITITTADYHKPQGSALTAMDAVSTAPPTMTTVSGSAGSNAVVTPTPVDTSAMAVSSFAGAGAGTLSAGATGNGTLMASVADAQRRSSALTQLALLPGDSLSESQASALFPRGEVDAHGEQLDLRRHTSWNSHVGTGAISALEVMETQVVNSVVPFLLVNELAAVMRARHAAVTKRDASLIAAVNSASFSAREMRALFELHPELRAEVEAAWAHEKQRVEREANASAYSLVADRDSKTAGAAVGGPAATAKDAANAMADDKSAAELRRDVAKATKTVKDAATAWGATSEHVATAWKVSETRRRVRARRFSFVVCVSSTEGQFATRGMKSTEHPHSNMAKAALNMLVRTSAPDLARDSIFMSAVDTGWCSRMRSGRPHLRSETAPLSDADGAARVLDPIYGGLSAPLSSAPVSGVLLQDFKPAPW